MAEFRNVQWQSRGARALDAGTKRHFRDTFSQNRQPRQVNAPQYPPELCSAPPRTGALGPKDPEPCAPATLSARGRWRWTHLAAGRGRGGRQKSETGAVLGEDRAFVPHPPRSPP